MGRIFGCLESCIKLSPQTLRKIWIGFGWAGVFIIVILSLMPSPPQPVHFEYADKLEHALAYGLVMLWFCQVYKLGKGLMVGLLLFALGVALEYMQGMTDYRSFEYADMLADATGLILAWGLAHTPLGSIYQCIEKTL